MIHINLNNATVAIDKAHARAETVVRERQRSGFAMEQPSIVGRDYHTDEHVAGNPTTGDRMRYWGKQGACWGGVWALVFGSAFFWIPGPRPLLGAGPLVTLVVGVLESAVVIGGLSAIGAGLYSLGFPEHSLLRLETAPKTSKFGLIVHGTREETMRAREIINRTNPES